MRDKISLDDIHNALCPVTVASIDLRDLAPAKSRKADNKIIMVFREFPDKEYIANATSYKTCVEKHGADWRTWVNKVIVLAPVSNEDPNTRTLVTKVHVAPPDDWAKALNAATKARRK
jgi:hypothetical protein